MARLLENDTSRCAVVAATPALNTNERNSFMHTPTVAEKPFRGQDLTGKRFGILTVTRFSHFERFGRENSRSAYWRCRCDCGAESTVYCGSLRRGKTISCGCIEAACRGQRHVKHADARIGKWHPMYSRWRGIQQRCNNPSSPAYKNYGGRGIKLLWRCWEDFKRDMEPTFQPSLSIDRIDNDGHYCKENCRWVDRKTQCRNTRKNRIVTINGISKTATDWNEIMRFPRGVVGNRLYRGWTENEAVTLPLGTRK